MRFLFALLFLPLLFASPAAGQPPADTCGAGDSLDGGDMFPISISATVNTNDLTMTGTGCDERGRDHVTCLTPTASCVVDAQCDAGFLVTDPQQQEAVGLQVAINAVEGACSTAPASCLDSDAGTGSGSITGLALTADTTYCFVCESQDPEEIALEIQATSGDCGALPVELQSFAIE